MRQLVSGIINHPHVLATLNERAQPLRVNRCSRSRRPTARKAEEKIYDSMTDAANLQHQPGAGNNDNGYSTISISCVCTHCIARELDYINVISVLKRTLSMSVGSGVQTNRPIFLPVCRRQHAASPPRSPITRTGYLLHTRRHVVVTETEGHDIVVERTENEARHALKVVCACPHKDVQHT